MFTKHISIEERSRQAVKFINEVFEDKAIVHMRFIHDYDEKQPTFKATVGKSKLKGSIKNWVYQSLKQRPIYPFSNNTKGYAMFFTVNSGGTKAEEINKINSYFCDADFGKIKYAFDNNEIEKIEKTVQELKQNPEIKRVTVKVKGEATTIEAVRTLETMKRLKQEFLEMFEKQLEGTLIVETRNGFHIYWLVEDGEIEDFVLVEEAIINIFGEWADKAVSDLPRILRIPGFLHYKEEDEPFICTVKQWGKRWRKQEIIQTLGLKIKKRKEERKERVGARKEHKKTAATTDLKFVRKAYSKKQEMTEADFLHWIKREPIQNFFKNAELKENRFSCHFHPVVDTKASAALYELDNGVQVYTCHGNCTKKGRDIISMYQALHGCGYRQALTGLAKIANVEFIETEFQQEQFKKYRDNRRFVKEELYDSDVFYAKFDHLTKYLNYKRPAYLRMMNDFAELQLSEEEFSVPNELKNKNGEVIGLEKHAIFFISYSAIASQMKQQSIESVFNTINILCLLGFITKVPKEQVPEKLMKRALLEKKKEDENIINFYAMNNFYDVEEFAESVAKELKEKKFTFKHHMNKIGIEKLLGREHAQRVFPDGRVIPKRFEGLEASIERFILKEIQKQGYVLEQDVMAADYKVLEANKEKQKMVRRKARKSTVEKTYKRAIYDICTKNDLELVTLNKDLRSEYNILVEGRKKIIKRIDKK
ncbi:hypothetical protein LKM01_25130 [Bacillus pacificus]|uniref:hypothetical protein n=1 Tax=Bacillus cereus group TaxID=86661 RepID=UPI001E613539|nr:hypothetical protein [Bacillus pacificus]MCC2485079.1 hypothetical protein [Bacillus pacificus]